MEKKPAKKNILIVDDEPEIRDVMGILLSEAGYRVRTAADGLEALDRIREAAPDLILLDMNMPRMGGIVFYHNIASSYDGSPKYPVIVLTARGDLENLFQDFKVHGFITKPFQYDELIEKIESVFKASPQQAAPAGESRKKTTKRKALIYDESSDQVHGVVLAFMNAGYDVLAPKNEKTVLKMAGLDSPDAVFLPLKPPFTEGPGYLLAQALRGLERAAAIPLFFYPAKAARIFPSAAEQITLAIPNCRILESPDPDILLSEFENLIRTSA